MIIARRFERNPFNAGRKSRYEFAIESPDSRFGTETPVDADGALVWPTRLKAGKKFSARGCILLLYQCPSTWANVWADCVRTIT